MVNGAARSILPSEFLNWTVVDTVLVVGIGNVVEANGPLALV
jgi:hypothetical protein